MTLNEARQIAQRLQRAGVTGGRSLVIGGAPKNARGHILTNAVFRLPAEIEADGEAGADLVYLASIDHGASFTLDLAASAKRLDKATVAELAGLIAEYQPHLARSARELACDLVLNLPEIARLVPVALAKL